MPYLLNKKLGRITDHEDLGLNKQGKREFRCKETGELRGYSKNKIQQIKAAREKAKEAEAKDTKDDLNYTSRGVSDDNIQQLRSFLDSRTQETATPNVAETRAH